MIITCAISQNIPYEDENGVMQLCTLLPGRNNYPMLKPKSDPILASTLFTLRKHGRISFDDLLPQDQDPDISRKASLKAPPAGRDVNNKSDSQKAKEAKSAREKVSNDTVNPSGSGKKNSKSPEASGKAADS